MNILKVKTSETVTYNYIIKCRGCYFSGKHIFKIFNDQRSLFNFIRLNFVTYLHVILIISRSSLPLSPSYQCGPDRWRQTLAPVRCLVRGAGRPTPAVRSSRRVRSAGGMLVCVSSRRPPCTARNASPAWG